MFQDILGHQDVKELLLAAMQAPRPVHALLEGAAGPSGCWPPAPRRPASRRRSWSSASLLLIDELDKMDGKHLV